MRDAQPALHDDVDHVSRLAVLADASATGILMKFYLLDQRQEVARVVIEVVLEQGDASYVLLNYFAFVVIAAARLFR